MIRRWAFAVFFLFFCFPCTGYGGEPCVEMFSPQGTVKKVRQVSVRFSDQMVKFGDPRLAAPFDIKSPEKGRGRWADGKNWVYDFERDLPAGVVCVFTFRQGLKTLAGKWMSGTRQFRFSTGGPTITASDPYESEYSTIAEDQVFILSLDAPAVEETVMARAYFTVAGMKDRIGVRILSGKERDELYGLYLRSHGSGAARNLVFIRAKQVFPAGAAVKLVWGTGIRSAEGIQTGAAQVLTFKTRESFSVTLACEQENVKAGCVPFLPVHLSFSAPVAWEQAQHIVLRGPSSVFKPNKPSQEESEFVSAVDFKGPFSETTAYAVEIPADLKDDAGREPANTSKFPLTIKTAAFPPLAKFSSRFGIIESADPVLPVTLRNIEPRVTGRSLAASVVEGRVTGRTERVDDAQMVIRWLQKIATTDRRHSVLAAEKAAQHFTVPRPEGQKAFEVVGIPLEKNGLHIIELESAMLGEALLGEAKPMYVPTAALVTNLAAHFKWGRESSLVWVTTLDGAEPVAGAAVTIRDCTGSLLWQGVTDKSGVALIPQELKAPEKICELDEEPETYWDRQQLEALDGMGGGLFAFAKTDDDMTFVHSSWEQGIEPWRFRLGEEAAYNPGHVRAHTVFDRSLFRAGETVHMKHVIRRHALAGFSFLEAEKLPGVAVIEHLGSLETFELPLTWDVNSGMAESTWKIPSGAHLGNYSVTLYQESASGQRRSIYDYCTDCFFTGQFKVAEFRLPRMKAVIQGPAGPLVHATAAELDLQVAYLSGGGAGGLPVKLRSMIEQRQVAFPDYEGFVFANGETREGMVEKPGDDDAGERGLGGPKPKLLQSAELTLEESGSLRTQVAGLPQAAWPQTLTAELEFRDPSGEVQTVSQKIPLWPAKLVLGLMPDAWTAARKLKFTVASLDTAGRPAGKVKISVDLFKRISYSHRKRLIGGFYSYENSAEIKKVARIFEGATDRRGMALAEVGAPAGISGQVILQAEAVDEDGNRATVYQDMWLAGDEDWYFSGSDSDRIDVLPEKKRYEVDDTAEFQVRMPFRKATALVTVEREGIIDTHVEKLSGKNPVVEVPVKGSYGPNVFVSVLAVRGRAADVQPTALVDLGRPAFKLGIAEIQVGWKGYELEVRVTAEKDTYKIRERAPVKLRVRRADGDDLPAGAEVAVSAVDEGLLELMPNKSWNLLEPMMKRRPYEVRTASAQMQVVGKRHYGLKALPQGGGGGMQATRELFDTLLLWQGRVQLDKNGEAKLEIPLNDAVTSFRITAVASAGASFFGTGQTSIRTTQDIMIHPGLPQVVRQGDRFRAAFTVRNGTKKKATMAVTAQVQAGSEKKDLAPVALELAAGAAQEAAWDITVPEDAAGLAWSVAARDTGSGAADSLRVAQKVVPAVAERVVQATLSQLKAVRTMTVQQPEAGLAGRGGVRVALSDSLAASPDGVRAYMQQYPYTCLEQRVSRAVALRDKALWQAAMDELASCLDADGLAKYFAACKEGSDVLTSYIVALADEAGWDIPAASSERMLKALEGFVQGKIQRRPALPVKDTDIRKLAAMEALARRGRAAPAQLESLRVQPAVWPTSALLDWISLLRRVPAIPKRTARLAEAKQLLRSRLNFQGTTLGFSTEGTDRMSWLMVACDGNAVRSVLTLLDFPDWREDMPRLVRAAISRQKRGAWLTTVANAWGVLALEKFSKKFEAAPVTGVSTARLGAQEKQCRWEATPAGDSLMLPWPGQKQAELTVSHEGAGRPWMTVQSIAAVVLTEPFSSGYTVKKTCTPVSQRQPGLWQPGDVVRVHLELEAQADMTWVVVNDPIPCGATILGSGLGRDSRILTTGERPQDRQTWPAFEERSFEAFRAYYEFVPKGAWSVEYTLRFNTAGVFQVPATRVEALYAPEVAGEIPNERISIEGVSQQQAVTAKKHVAGNCSSFRTITQAADRQ